MDWCVKAAPLFESAKIEPESDPSLYTDITEEYSKRHGPEHYSEMMKKSNKRRSTPKKCPYPSARRSKSKSEVTAAESEYYLDGEKREPDVLHNVIKSVFCTKVVILLYAIIISLSLHTRDDCYTCNGKPSPYLSININDMMSAFATACMSIMPLVLFPLFFVYFTV